MRVKRSKLSRSLGFKRNKIQLLLTKSIKIKPPRLPPSCFVVGLTWESPPGPFRKQLRGCRVGSCSAKHPSAWQHRGERPSSEGSDDGCDTGRGAGAGSQPLGLIRAQLGYPAPREQPCKSRRFAGSDSRRLWLHQAGGRDPLGIATTSCCPSTSGSRGSGRLGH